MGLCVYVHFFIYSLDNCKVTGMEPGSWGPRVKLQPWILVAALLTEYRVTKKGEASEFQEFINAKRTIRSTNNEIISQMGLRD